MAKPDQSAHKPLLVELIGPAGAGKTTLADSLVRGLSDVLVAPIPKLRRWRSLSYLVRNLLPLLSILLSQDRDSPFLTWQEVKRMVHLNGWLRVLETERGDRCTVVLLDHGPIYMLASLREFALSVRQNEVFRSWWDERLAHWAYSLDLVVWLDASNEVLEERINRRDHPHLVKGRPQPEIHEFLTRYRSSFENTVSRAVAVNRRLDVHRLRTEAETPENISAMIASGIQSQLKQIPSD